MIATPKGDRVLIRPVLNQKSKLLLPEKVVRDHTGKAKLGRVVSVGNDCEYLAPNDKVYYLKQAKSMVEIGGEWLLLARESDVIAKVNE